MIKDDGDAKLEWSVVARLTHLRISSLGGSAHEPFVQLPAKTTSSSWDIPELQVTED